MILLTHIIQTIKGKKCKGAQAHQFNPTNTVTLFTEKLWGHWSYFLLLLLLFYLVGPLYIHYDLILCFYEVSLYVNSVSLSLYVTFAFFLWFFFFRVFVSLSCFGLFYFYFIIISNTKEIWALFGLFVCMRMGKRYCGFWWEDRSLAGTTNSCTFFLRKAVLGFHCYE